MIRVLIADDHQIVRDGLRLVVNGQPDMQVVAEVADGRSRVDTAASLSPDVIIRYLAIPGVRRRAPPRAV